MNNKTDWKYDLKVAAALIREQQKNKKRERSKFVDMENFRGRKGFNDTGIPLTEHAVKQQRKNKLSYKKNNYAGSRLNFINDARAEAARQRRLDNPEHKKRIDTMFKIADERIESDDKQQQYQVDLHRMRSRSSDTSFRYMKPRGYGTESVDDGSVELDPYAVDAAGASVINQDPEFKDKVNESIYRLLKNKK